MAHSVFTVKTVTRYEWLESEMTVSLDVGVQHTHVCENSPALAVWRSPQPSAS